MLKIQNMRDLIIFSLIPIINASLSVTNILLGFFRVGFFRVEFINQYFGLIYKSKKHFFGALYS